MKPWINSLRMIPWPPFLAAIFVMVSIHHNTLYRLFIWEWSRVAYQYSYIIPLVMGFLMWRRRREFASVQSKPSWGGLHSIMIGCFFLLFGELGGEFFSLYLSIWFMLVGLCWTQLGWRKLKIILFPLALLLTTFPPPRIIYVRLLNTVQAVSTKIATLILKLFQIPVYSQGRVIEFAGVRFEVVDGYYDLRFLIPVLIVALLLVYMSRAKWWQKALVLMVALPLALFMNGTRIAILALWTNSHPDTSVSWWAHEILGWPLSLIAIGCLLGLILLVPGRYIKSRRQPDAPLDVDPVEAAAKSAFKKPVRFKYLQYIVALSVLVGAFFFLQYRERTEDFPPQAPNLESFPVDINAWQGRRSFFPSQIVEELDLSEYVLVDFTGPKGKGINFYTAWYATQSKGKSIHTPETCLRGGGWQFQQAQTINVILSNYENSPVRLNRSLLKSGDRQWLMYFWFRCRGRNLVNAYELKFFNFWDRLMMRRTDGAVVWGMTPIAGSETRADAEKRLQRFFSSALPILDTYLP